MNYCKIRLEIYVTDHSYPLISSLIRSPESRRKLTISVHGMKMAALPPRASALLLMPKTWRAFIIREEMSRESAVEAVK